MYELPPGQAICPYHYEYGEEEWLLVLEGRPTLRTPEGEAEIGPLEMAFFPGAPDGAHQVRNTSDATVRVLMFSTRTQPAVSVYPDSGKVGVFTGNKADDLMVRKTSGVDYFDGETSAQARWSREPCAGGDSRTAGGLAAAARQPGACSRDGGDACRLASWRRLGRAAQPARHDACCRVAGGVVAALAATPLAHAPRDGRRARCA